MTTSPGGRFDRRTMLRGTGAVALAAGGLIAAGAACAAPDGSDMVTRALPGSGERIPVIGLGTFMTFDRLATAERGFIPQVLRAFHDGGGRVVDTSALYGASEANVGEYARELGLTDSLFLTDKSWNCGEYLFDASHAENQFARSLERLHRTRLDVVGVHSMTNVGMILPVLRRFRDEGRVRFIGVTSHEAYQYAGMEPLIRSRAVDFVQVRYSMFDRAAEQRVLPLAAEHGVAVMVNMALEKGRLHHAVGSAPLPEFAVEWGYRSWSEYFLKFVVAHPAVTCVVPATTSVEHVRENLAAMRGPLPDADQRARMLRHVETFPGFARVGSTPWYPGKRFTDGLVRLPDPAPAG